MAKIIRLPGLIDIHVHLRDPGQTYKEDFYTGTCAALAGGVTAVFDMPNNITPVFSSETLEEKINVARQKAVCDFGVYFGTDGKNTDEFEKVADKVVGLKVYLSQTTGKYVISDEDLIKNVFKAWPKTKILVVHAEGDRVDLAIKLATEFSNKLHITHVDTKESLEKIIVAKKNNLNITCDTTPHYLFLSKEQINDQDTSGVTGTGSPDGGRISKEGYYSVKPPLATKEDQGYLWNNLDKIDCLSSDHAPHTIDDKKQIPTPAGVPGLETMLPLMLTAVKDKRLSLDKVIELTNLNPQKIFGFKQEENTYIEVDTQEKYMIKNEDLKTKCGWSPFNGWEVEGKVKRVFIRGTKVFENGKVLNSAGFGRNILHHKINNPF